MTTIFQPAGANLPIASPTLEDLELIPLTGLRGLWQFTEGAGNTVADLTGISGPAIITPGAGGWNSQGFALDGAASYITLPVTASDSFTWFVVFKGDSTQPAAQGAVMSTASPYTSYGDNILWQKSNDQIYRQKVGTSGNNSVALTAGLAAAGFLAILATASGTSYDVQGLSSGVRDSNTVTGAQIPGTASVIIGRNPANTGPGYSYAKGTVAAVGVWARALSNVVIKSGVPTERQKVLTFQRPLMAAKSITI